MNNAEPHRLLFRLLLAYSFLRPNRSSRWRRATVAPSPSAGVARDRLQGVGGAPLTEQYEPKARYSVHDFERSARYAGIRYRTRRSSDRRRRRARAVLWLQRRRPTRRMNSCTPYSALLPGRPRHLRRGCRRADRAVHRHRRGGADAGGAGPEMKDELRQRVRKRWRSRFGAPRCRGGEVFWATTGCRRSSAGWRAALLTIVDARPHAGRNARGRRSV